MFKRTRTGLLVGLALLSSLVLAACGPSSATDVPAAANTVALATTAAATTAAAGNEIRIGLMAPLTGGSATLGAAIKRGADMAVEEINAAGGVNGRKIVTIERDDKADPETGINNVRDLIDKEKVFALLGTANTGVGTKQAPIVNQSKVPWVVPVTTGSSITRDPSGQPVSYVFRVSMQDAEQTPFVAAYVADTLKAKKIALLHDDSGYGTLGRDDLLKALSEKSITPVLVEQFKLNDAADNFNPLLTKVKQSGADVIIMWCLGADAANVRKATKAAGLDIPTIGSWGLSMPPFPNNANGLEAGTIVPQTIAVDTTNPKQKEFFDKYKKKYTTDSVGFPSGLTQSYDAMYILANAMKQAGATDSRDKLRDALENFGTYDGVIKKYEQPFKNQYHEAFVRTDFFLTVWKDGKMVKLDSK